MTSRGSAVTLGGLVAVLGLLPVVVKDAFLLHVLIVMDINVMMAVSMWFLGITGLISFGQAGFMFIGAMTSTLLAKRLGWPVWVSLPLAGVVPALVSIPVGKLTLRVKGVYFFLVTLAFGEVVRGIFAYFSNPFGGWYGIRDIPPPEPASLFTTLNKVPFYYLGLGLTVLTCIVVYRLSRSWVGTVLWSIREGDVLAESVGIDVAGYKLLALVVASVFTGLAGSFYAHYFGYISPLVFTLQYSVNILTFIVIGGLHSFAGPVVGAAFLTVVPELFRVTGKYQMLIFGLILVVALLLMPRGLVGLWEWCVGRAAARSGGRREAAAASPDPRGVD